MTFRENCFLPTTLYQTSPLKNWAALLEKKSIRVVADGMHGYGGILWEQLFSQLNLKGQVIRSQRDPLFGGITPNQLKKMLLFITNRYTTKSCHRSCCWWGWGPIGSCWWKRALHATTSGVPLILLHLLENRRLKGKLVQTASLGYLSNESPNLSGLKQSKCLWDFKYVAEKWCKPRWFGEEKSLEDTESVYGLWKETGYCPVYFYWKCFWYTINHFQLFEKTWSPGLGTLFSDDKIIRFEHRSLIKANGQKRFPTNCPKKMLDKKIREFRILDGLKLLGRTNRGFFLRPSGRNPLWEHMRNRPQRKNRTTAC